MHPAYDFANTLMQVSFAGTRIWLSDGATNIMPVGPHRAAEGKSLTQDQSNRREPGGHIHRARDRITITSSIRSRAASIRAGIWHPAQLPTALRRGFSRFLPGKLGCHASERLHNFVEKAAKATLVGDVFDDAATGQGLLNYFPRAINCG